jgi:hypothetical protein
MQFSGDSAELHRSSAAKDAAQDDKAIEQPRCHCRTMQRCAPLTIPRIASKENLCVTLL